MMGQIRDGILIFGTLGVLIFFLGRTYQETPVQVEEEPKGQIVAEEIVRSSETAKNSPSVQTPAAKEVLKGKTTKDRIRISRSKPQDPKKTSRNVELIERLMEIHKNRQDAKPRAIRDRKLRDQNRSEHQELFAKLKKDPKNKELRKKLKEKILENKQRVARGVVFEVDPQAKVQEPVVRGVEDKELEELGFDLDAKVEAPLTLVPETKVAARAKKSASKKKDRELKKLVKTYKKNLARYSKTSKKSKKKRRVLRKENKKLHKEIQKRITQKRVEQKEFIARSAAKKEIESQFRNVLDDNDPNIPAFELARERNEETQKNEPAKEKNAISKWIDNVKTAVLGKSDDRKTVAKRSPRKLIDKGITGDDISDAELKSLGLDIDADELEDEVAVRGSNDPEFEIREVEKEEPGLVSQWITAAKEKLTGKSEQKTAKVEPETAEKIKKRQERFARQEQVRQARVEKALEDYYAPTPETKRKEARQNRKLVTKLKKKRLSSKEQQDIRLEIQEKIQKQRVKQTLVSRSALPKSLKKSKKVRAAKSKRAKSQKRREKALPGVSDRELKELGFDLDPTIPNEQELAALESDPELQAEYLGVRSEAYSEELVASKPFADEKSVAPRKGKSEKKRKLKKRSKRKKMVAKKARQKKNLKRKRVKRIPERDPLEGYYEYSDESDLVATNGELVISPRARKKVDCNLSNSEKCQYRSNKWIKIANPNNYRASRKDRKVLPKKSKAIRNDLELAHDFFSDLDDFMAEVDEDRMFE